jgi:hypothetical protein
VELMEAVEKMEAAAERMEAAATLMMQHESAQREALQAAAEATVAITATVASEREEELENRLAAAESTIAELRAGVASTRKTAVAMHAKGEAAVEASALDAALTSLSIEQRFAVKAAMLRAGLAG